ncbi:hypothetical protein G9C98_007679 [Cotesia typhae]|uniref:GATOR complex protein NPRL3 n=1 Tax=Cotesia typhae TaxID=2053667 RepID=A0A8J5QJN6_9HYME|nr:hypothetical protein G9C98_007679 [Cotesia typhae]
MLCLNSLRPYHGLLLLIEPVDLLESLPTDASPALRRMIHMYNPLKSLQTLAADTDLSLAQIFQLTGHLVYWAKATVIYPLCESNETRNQDCSSPNRATENDSSLSYNNTPKGISSEMRIDKSISMSKEEEIFEYRSENFPISSEDIMLLDKLCGLNYFDGQHHLEEIMYLENIRRSQLLEILEKFRNILIISKHEDPAITLFYSQHGFS